MQFTSLNTVGFADIHESQLSGASTLSSMIQQMTIGMGIAVGAIALRLAGALHSTNAGSLTAGDFRIAFALVGVIALVAELLVNEEGVLQLWRLNLIRCSHVSRPIHFRTIHVGQFELEVIFLAVGWICASRFPIATLRGRFLGDGRTAVTSI